MKIVKTIINNPYWGYGIHHEEPYIQPHLYIDIQSENLEIKLYTPATENVPMIVHLWQKLALSTLKSIPGFVDQTLWTSLEKTPIPEIDGEQSFYELKNSDLVDILGRTLVTKNVGNGNNSGFNRTPYVLYVGDSSGDFNDFTMVLKLNDPEEFIFEGPSASSITSETVAFASDLLPSISLTSSQNSVGVDSSITVDVTSDPSVKEVYLEQVYGVLNKTRVPLTNGVGSFVILTTGLSVGDMVRVKAGHRKYTGITDFNITVS
jgi:hypothetical protein